MSFRRTSGRRGPAYWRPAGSGRGVGYVADVGDLSATMRRP